jgi:hypothetical protein
VWLLLRTCVSEERIASIIKVTRIGNLGTTLAVTSNRSTLRNIPEEGILHTRRRENLKPYNSTFTLLCTAVYIEPQTKVAL